MVLLAALGAGGRRLAILIVPVYLMFCALPPVPAATPEPRPGGTLTAGVEAEFQGFDPLRARIMGISTLTAAVTLHETLVRFDADGRIAPALALLLAAAADGRTWTAELRPDVVFHDGTPFDAAAVSFHFSRLLDPANACPCRELIAPLRAVEATGPLTVAFRLEQPWAALPAVLAEPSIVSLIGSPRAIRELGADYHRHPVGTGPFVFDSWQTAAHRRWSWHRLLAGY